MQVIGPPLRQVTRKSTPCVVAHPPAGVGVGVSCRRGPGGSRRLPPLVSGIRWLATHNRQRWRTSLPKGLRGHHTSLNLPLTSNSPGIASFKVSCALRSGEATRWGVMWESSPQSSDGPQPYRHRGRALRPCVLYLVRETRPVFGSSLELRPRVCRAAPSVVNVRRHPRIRRE